MRTIDQFLKAQVYNGKIPNEVMKPQNYQCFPGAWYYKALSSKDYWLGIEGIVSLPEFIPDENRVDFIKDNIDPTKTIKRYKDTPSVYVGGSSDYETDIGFGWFRGLVDNKISNEKICFRPFYRYIYIDNSGETKNIYEGPSINETQFYFFPGDEVKINVVCTNDDYLCFRLELIKETSIESYKKIRERLDKKPQIFLTKEFPSPGNGIRKTEFKRVNAIDQYNNEGRPSQNTNAYTKKSVWKEVYLFRNINKKLMKVPFTDSRYIKMKCPNDYAFKVNINNDEEEIYIIPSYQKKEL